MENEEAQSEATFRFTVPNFKNLKNSVWSPPCYVRNLPWKIIIKPYEVKRLKLIKYLGFYLECNGDSESCSWSCYARAELRLISHKPDTETISQKIQHLFNSKKKEWGVPLFTPWSKILDPEKGYLKDDGSITLEVHVTAYAPHGVSCDSKKHTGNVGSQMAISKATSGDLSECPLCKDTFEPVFYCKSGHSFCPNCTSKLFPHLCPRCREIAPEPNNICLEEVIKPAKLFCPNKSLGCQYELFNKDQVNEHVKECIFREMSCPMETSGKCSWRGTVKTMKDHCKENHEANFITATNEDINLEEVDIAKDDQRVFLYAQGNFLFIVTFQIDTSKTIAYWTVQSIGTKKAVRQYVHEIHVTSKHDPRRKTIFMDLCYNHALKSEEVFGFGKCGMMPLSMLSHFIKEEKFSFRFLIDIKEVEEVDTKNESNESNPELETNGSDDKVPVGCQMAISKAASEDLSECPVCKKTLAPVFYCKSGHGYCPTCKLLLLQCPRCREIANKSNTKFLEEMIKPAKIFCQNKSLGCKYKLSLSQMNVHVKECIFREMSCPMETSGKCSWRGAVKTMKDHCKENHEANFITATNEDINLEEVDIAKDDQRVFLYAQGNFLFIVTFQIDTSKTIAYWTVQSIGTKKAVRQYVHEIHVTSKHDPRRKTIFMDLCYNQALKSEEVIGFDKCGMMPLSMLSHFIKDEKFSFRFLIDSIKIDEKVDKKNESNDSNSAPETKGSDDAKAGALSL